MSPSGLIIIGDRTKQKHCLVTDACMRRLHSNQLPLLNPYLIKPEGMASHSFFNLIYYTRQQVDNIVVLSLSQDLGEAESVYFFFNPGTSVSQRC